MTKKNNKSPVECKLKSSFLRRFRSIARSYFRKAHGVLLLYDVTSESSFLNMRAWVDQIQVSVDTLSTLGELGA